MMKNLIGKLKKIRFICFILSGLLFVFLHNNSRLIYSQSVFSSSEQKLKEIKKRQKLFKEMEEIIEKAEEAGFTEEEIKQITVERDEKLIHVWDYVQKEKKRLEDKKKESRKLQTKKYFTIEDITEELQKYEGNQITELRENLIFSGEQQE